MTEWSRSFFWLGICGVFSIPISVSAKELNFQSDTIFRFYQRDTATKKDAAVSPVYEYVKLDLDSPDESGLAFHLNGWGRSDMANNGYYTDETDGELLSGYMEYTGEQAHFKGRLGRQHIFEGVGNEVVDGLRLSSDLGKYFSGTVYTGAPVGLGNEEGSSGDSIYGGRLAPHLTGLFDMGLSYKKIRNHNIDVEEKAGVDLSAYLPYGINLYSFSAYNFDSEDWGEHSAELSFTIGQVSLRPYFQKFQYEDYFGKAADSVSVNPFRFLADTGEVLQVGGADLTLPIGETWSLAAKAKHYDYKVLNDTSQYFSGEATWTSEKQIQIGAELGYMNGDAAQNDYYLVRMFTYWDKLPEGSPVSFVSGDVVYVGYHNEIYGEDRSSFVSLGAGKKFMEDALELKLSADYSRDPYFDGDLRAMLTVSYRYGREL